MYYVYQVDIINRQIFVLQLSYLCIIKEGIQDLPQEYKWKK